MNRRVLGTSRGSAGGLFVQLDILRTQHLGQCCLAETQYGGSEGEGASFHRSSEYYTLIIVMVENAC